MLSPTELWWVCGVAATAGGAATSMAIVASSAPRHEFRVRVRAVAVDRQVYHRGGVHRTAFRGRSFTDDALERGKSLGHDLVHVVVLVGRKAPNEMRTRRYVGERLVARVQLGIFGARDRIVRVAFSLRILA